LATHPGELGGWNRPELGVHFREKISEALTLQLVGDGPTDEPGKTPSTDRLAELFGELARNAHRELRGTVTHVRFLPR
jgi:hypothetical protein